MRCAASFAAAPCPLPPTGFLPARTNAGLDPFGYAASHDLKAPITNIEGLYLPGPNPKPMIPRLLGLMQGAIARFQQTVGTSPTFRASSSSSPPRPWPWPRW